MKPCKKNKIYTHNNLMNIQCKFVQPLSLESVTIRRKLSLLLLQQT